MLRIGNAEEFLSKHHKNAVMQKFTTAAVG